MYLLNKALISYTQTLPDGSQEIISEESNLTQTLLSFPSAVRQSIEYNYIKYNSPPPVQSQSYNWNVFALLLLLRYII